MQYRRMGDTEPILTLRSGEAETTVHPAAGARLGQVTVAGQSLLIDVPAADERTATSWGSFPMVPWAGRIARGRFEFEGVDHQLVLNHRDGTDASPERAHAIHGLGFERAWEVLDVGPTACTTRYVFDWEFGGFCTQTVALFDDRVVSTLHVEATAGAFPAEVGWHPWFRTPDRLDFAPTAMYERDAVGIPTGSLVDVSTGPWDDCFINTEPVVMHYDRAVAPTVTVTSGCDHWVVFDHFDDATCVEPQSGPPDAFNLSPHVVAPGADLVGTMTIAW